MPLGALIFPWRMQNLLREYAASVAEKPLKFFGLFRNSKRKYKIRISKHL